MKQLINNLKKMHEECKSNKSLKNNNEYKQKVSTASIENN
jgi:hypothetical protein